jgi:dolichol-phosphate mannosyltransferase|tara:strand:- start:213 stop:926 length:714 start_codon:yes stop_codon:yes gene_type:complete
MNHKDTIIIIPTYKEELNIGLLIEKIKNDYPDIFILVVDDSPDGLTKLAVEQVDYKKLYLISNKTKLGRGFAVRRGFEYALKNNFLTIIEMDSDFSHDPNELGNMINEFNNKELDLLMGSRYLKESTIVNWPLKRILFSSMANLLAKILFSFSFSDYTNGYRIYNKNLIQELMKYSQINKGFLYLTETLVIANLKGFKISECATYFKDRGRGKSSVRLKNIYESLIGIFKIKFNRFN